MITPQEENIIEILKTIVICLISVMMAITCFIYPLKITKVLTLILIIAAGGFAYVQFVITTAKIRLWRSSNINNHNDPGNYYNK